MSREQEHLKKIAEAQDALGRAETGLHDAAAAAAAAHRNRRGAAPTATDAALRKLREADELAQERLDLATRARDEAQAWLVTLQIDLQHAIDADQDARADELCAAMREPVRRAAAMRAEADRIEQEGLAALWPDYVQAAGLLGQPIDPAVEAPDNRPRNLADLRASTARLDGTVRPETPLEASERLHKALGSPHGQRREDSAPDPWRPGLQQSGWHASPPPKPANESPDFEWADVGPGVK